MGRPFLQCSTGVWLLIRERRSRFSENFILLILSDLSYAFIYIYIYTFAYLHIHVYVHMCVCVCLCVCACVRVCVCVCECVRVDSRRISLLS